MQMREREISTVRGAPENRRLKSFASLITD